MHFCVSLKKTTWQRQLDSWIESKNWNSPLRLFVRIVFWLVFWESMEFSTSEQEQSSFMVSSEVLLYESLAPPPLVPMWSTRDVVIQLLVTLGRSFEAEGGDATVHALMVNLLYQFNIDTEFFQWLTND